MTPAVLTRIVFLLIAAYVVAPSELMAGEQALSYTLTPMNLFPATPLAINDRGEVLIQRQLVEFAQPAPIIINKEGIETRPFECPTPTEPSAEGSTLNNRREVVGTCGGRLPFGFVASLDSAGVTLVRYPGANATWAYGSNDLGQVVGFYTNTPDSTRPLGHLHAYLYDPATGTYRTIDHPYSVQSVGPTFLTHINNKGQIAGYHVDQNNIPSISRYSFIYENGSFTQVRHPRSWDDYSTFIYGLNNRGQIFGGYSGPDCHQSRCLFFYNGAEYLDVSLPIPNNAPYPRDMSVSPATALGFGGLNDSGQFVGYYRRVLEWRPDPTHPGDFFAASSEFVDFVATPQTLLNDSVSFGSSSSSFQNTTDTAGCPAGFVGKFDFDASLTNTSRISLANVMVRANELSNGNVLQNADYAAAGVGAMLSIFKNPTDAERTLSPGESVPVHFSVCLKDYNPFTLFVDVFGLTRQ